MTTKKLRRKPASKIIRKVPEKKGIMDRCVNVTFRCDKDMLAEIDKLHPGMGRSTVMRQCLRLGLVAYKRQLIESLS